MADMVRAVVQTGPRQMELREFPRPVIGPDDGALLRVEACGICGSDVEQYKGAMGTRGLPMIPGHEPLGIIEEIAPRAAARWGVSGGDPRRLHPARARPWPVRRLRRVHAPAPELDRAPGPRRHPGRDRRDVQPARGGRGPGTGVRGRATRGPG